MRGVYPCMRRRTITELYHLAESSNLPSILQHGLLSAERLFALAGVPHVSALRAHRPACLRLSDGILVRDQKPMSPNLLAPALDGGLTPADWYALVNRFVFLLPDRTRLVPYRRAYAARPQVLLVFDPVRVLTDCAERTWVSPINSGNARRRAARRGPQTWVPYERWVRAGWEPRSKKPVEVLVDGFVPTTAAYLKDVVPA